MRAIFAQLFIVFDKGPIYGLAALVFAMKMKLATYAKLTLITLLSYSSAVVADHFALVDDQLPSDTGFHKPGILAKADTSLARVLENSAVSVVAAPAATSSI